MDIKAVNQAGQEEPKLWKEKSGLSAFIDTDFSDSETTDLTAGKDEYIEWCRLERERQADNPIAYWWSNQHRWPHLARFALDLLAIPVMSENGCLVIQEIW
jgi:hAT family protein